MAKIKISLIDGGEALTAVRLLGGQALGARVLNPPREEDGEVVIDTRDVALGEGECLLIKVKPEVTAAEAAAAADPTFDAPEEA